VFSRLREFLEYSRFVATLICIKYSRSITCQSNSSKRHGHGDLPNWNLKIENVNYPVTANFVSRTSSITNHVRFLFIDFGLLCNVFPMYRWRPFFGLEFSLSAALLTSAGPVVMPDCHVPILFQWCTYCYWYFISVQIPSVYRHCCLCERRASKHPHHLSRTALICVIKRQSPNQWYSWKWMLKSVYFIFVKYVTVSGW